MCTNFGTFVQSVTIIPLSDQTITPNETWYKHIEYIDVFSSTNRSCSIKILLCVIMQTKCDAIRRAQERAISQLVSFGKARTKARFKMIVKGGMMN